MSSVNPARVAAARVLAAVEDGAHAEEELERRAPEGDTRDRALAWFLVLGVLRRLATVDAAISEQLSRPLSGLEPAVRAVLRMGTFEALMSRVPPHAVVDQAVEVARIIGAGRASGLINAVLRRVRQPERLSRAERLEHPAWLVKRWDARYGQAAVDAWCTANAEPAALYAGVHPAHEVALLAAWDAAGIAWRRATVKGHEVPGSFEVLGRGEEDGRLRAGRPDGLPGWREGWFWVQDVASAWVTDLVGAGPGTVLDACAAPGGKTFRLASHGRDVVAVDIDEHRLALLDEGARRLQLDVMTGLHDWTLGRSGLLGTYDVVLVDAPCTGLGTLRRHPEIRWRRGAGDAAGAADRQRAVLEGASQHVSERGAIVYIVCSPEPEEGPDVIAAFIRAHPAWSVVEERTTAPAIEGCDAFYGARLERR